MQCGIARGTRAAQQPDPRENRVGGWAKKCARCCGCGPSLRFRSVSLLRVQKESMKAMRGLVSLGECCFSSSRSLPLIASPRLRRLQHHAPLGSPRAPRPPGPLASAAGAVAVELV